MRHHYQDLFDMLDKIDADAGTLITFSLIILSFQVLMLGVMIYDYITTKLEKQNE